MPILDITTNISQKEDKSPKENKGKNWININPEINRKINKEINEINIFSNKNKKGGTKINQIELVNNIKTIGKSKKIEIDQLNLDIHLSGIMMEKQDEINIEKIYLKIDKI